MLPHLKQIEAGIQSIEGYLKRLNPDAELDEKGHFVVQMDQVRVHIVVFPNVDKVVFKAYINMLPDPATGKVLPLYYHLLDMNDSPDTGLAFFAIVASEEVGTEHDVISVEAKRQIIGISQDEFQTCLTAVGEVSNAWMERLEQEFDAPHIP
jgi:hypothetical protein